MASDMGYLHLQSLGKTLREGLAWRFKQIRRPISILLNGADAVASLKFVLDSALPVSRVARLHLITCFYLISLRVESPHRQWEIIRFVREILRHSQGSTFVEAGSFKGSSAAKFSLAASLVGAKLVVFDSFEGMPSNEERHDRSIFGQDLSQSFVKGKYAGTFEEVRSNVRKFGSIENCEFVSGWFEDTMPKFSQRISGAYVDVDLASSTKTCIKNLFPLLGQGDLLVSQDGHIPLVIEVFRDADFWRHEIGLDGVPEAEGLGTSKLVVVTKR